ncbi:uncharacterized protein KY384_000636 [Bacidia gigantensis]|uniref:uncharacterized protein n=1 Tax=Bacidia gigantensis TaxID=2732470 RepID=UPI001D03EFA0|nr:uncharacterized protein KY384_000636 [Bacidia gigantensis]KAG8525876.1 hypothetical protein KY384_000636 [Bacidia gigantensis]
MSRPRTFSFDQNDETSLNANHPGQSYGHALPPPYTDDVPPPPAPSHKAYPASSYQLPPLDTNHDRRAQQSLDHNVSNRTASTTTPGADNLGDAAVGGGITGVALGVAHTRPRESGLEAIRDTEPYQRSPTFPGERELGVVGSVNPYIPEPSSPSLRASLDPPPASRDMALGPPSGIHSRSESRDPFASPAHSRHSNPFDDHRVSPTPSAGRPTPVGYPSTASIPMKDYPPSDAFASGGSYSDNPYNRYSSAWDSRISRADIDPNEIDDDAEDDMGPSTHWRKSMLGLSGGVQGNMSQGADTERNLAAGSGALGALGALVGSKSGPKIGSRDASGQYGPVGDPPMDEPGAEKSEWLNSQTSGRKRLRWIVGTIIALIIVGAIVGGVVGGVKHAQSKGDSPSSQSAQDDDGNGDLDKNSGEIKKLMNNPDLHKVMPGVDYTPFNGQYPDCLTNPPSQNNVTRDVAVLSQLTNTIRLYGTDCNQTEMVLHAISKLDLQNFKVWLGVWLDGNQTTNDRGMQALDDLLGKNGADPFAGVIIGNEALYRKEITEDKLGQLLSDTKKKLTDKKIDLPVGTSDLGDAWTASLASDVDVVMANVHPFFAGVTVDKAAGWTWDFWQGHNVKLTQGTQKKNYISEVGWPSDGGIHCAPDQTTCTEGSKAGIDEMNEFMNTFICQSLANSTDFFWFEAFDEPWKKRLNEPGKEWEDKWGLMDPGRKLKAGLKIPDCAGRTIS